MAPFAPGHSAGRTSIFGDYTQQTDAVLDIEIGGISVISEYDEVQVTGTAVLDGALQLSLINGFVPNAGNVFGILTAGALSGVFTNVANGERLDTIDGLGSFLVHYGPGGAFPPNRIFLTDFEPNALPGDFNHDGTVDAADYVVWRKTDGTPAGYNTMAHQFRPAAGSGSVATANATVPEPATLVMLIVTAAGVSTRRRWRTWRVSKLINA